MSVLARISYREPPGPRKARTGFQAVCCLAVGGLLAGLSYTCDYANAPRKVITGQMTSLYCQSTKNGHYSEFTIIGPNNKSVPLTVPDCSRQWQEGETVTAAYVSGFTHPLSLRVMNGSNAGILRTYSDMTGSFLSVSLIMPCLFVVLAAIQWKRMPEGILRVDNQRGQDITALNLNR